jgi:hypothetical protein
LLDLNCDLGLDLPGDRDAIQNSWSICHPLHGIAASRCAQSAAIAKMEEWKER